MNSPKVYIIILNWNGLADTLECLYSLTKLTYPDFKILVIDNASKDDSVAVIENMYFDIEIIVNTDNLGFTGGNNVGIQYAIDNNTDYVWLLNNDTIVEPDCLSKLVDMMNNNRSIGISSPVIYYHDTPEVVQFCGAYFKEKENDVMMYHEITPDEIIALQKNCVLWGTAMLIRRELLEKVGFLNEKYFAYHEDCEFSVRSIKAGFINRVCSVAKIYHKDSKSTGGKTSTVQVWLRARNEIFLWSDILKKNKLIIYGILIAKTIRRCKSYKDANNENAVHDCLNGAWAAVIGTVGFYNSEITMPRLLKIIALWIINNRPYLWADLFELRVNRILNQAFKRLI